MKGGHDEENRSGASGGGGCGCRHAWRVAAVDSGGARGHAHRERRGAAGDVVEVAVAGTDGITLQADGAVVRHLFLQGPGVGAGNDNGILVDADNTIVSGVEARGWRAAIASLNAQGTLGGGRRLPGSQA